MPETLFIQLGSNSGDRERYLDKALERLSSVEGLEIVAASGIYISEAQGMAEDAPQFLNQVIKADYMYPPRELLHSIEKIELELGRTDKGKNLPRTIDLDILLFGDQIIDSPDLRIPHPELLNRPFVIVPLLEIDPDLRHPAGKRLISEFLSDEDNDKIILFRDHVARTV